MFFTKKLGLFSATLIAVETLSISSAQGLSFQFHFTEPLPTNSLLISDGGSLRIDDFFANLQVGNVNANQYQMNTFLNVSTKLGQTGNGTLYVAQRQPQEWYFFGINNWYVPTGITWQMRISCGLNLMDCANSRGWFWIRPGSTMNPVSYEGGIIVDNFSLSSLPPPLPPPPPPPPPNSVPEPSFVWGLLLLSGGLFLRKKLKIS